MDKPHLEPEIDRPIPKELLVEARHEVDAIVREHFPDVDYSTRELARLEALRDAELANRHSSRTLRFMGIVGLLGATYAAGVGGTEVVDRLPSMPPAQVMSASYEALACTSGMGESVIEEGYGETLRRYTITVPLTPGQQKECLTDSSESLADAEDDVARQSTTIRQTTEDLDALSLQMQELAASPTVDPAQLALIHQHVASLRELYEQNNSLGGGITKLLVGSLVGGYSLLLLAKSVVKKDQSEIAQTLQTVHPTDRYFVLHAAGYRSTENNPDRRFNRAVTAKNLLGVETEVILPELTRFRSLIYRMKEFSNGGFMRTNALSQYLADRRQHPRYYQQPT